MRIHHLAAWAALATVFIHAPSTEAHTRRRSYSAWTWEGRQGRVTVRFDERSVAELIFGPGLESGTMTRESFERMARLPPQLLMKGMTVTQGSLSCPLTLGSDVSSRQGNWFIVRGRYRCPEPVQMSGVQIRSSLIPGSGLDHVHFMRWRVIANGDLLSDGHTALGLGGRDFVYAGDTGQRVGQTFGSMLAQGILHVLLGYDHLAFLLTLILVSWYRQRKLRRALSELMQIALGFTVGHSLTLGLATTNTVHVAEATVEFLIALSVAGLAFEGILRGQRDHLLLRYVGILCFVALSLTVLIGFIDHSPAAVIGMALFIAVYACIQEPGPWARASVATVFGLIHGFGFAGALSELSIDGPNLLTALLAFNVGVEAGQWVVIGLVVAILVRLAKEQRRRSIFEWGCGATLWLGLFWMAQRAM
ncbi:MAG: HupE/UreJ family protein [Myxococcota bacterium]